MLKSKLSADVLRQIYTVNPFVTLQEIGDTFGLSRERVRQIAAKNNISIRRQKQSTLRETITAEQWDHLSPEQQQQLSPSKRWPKSIQAFRKVSGLCYRCDKPASPGHTMCEEHLVWMRDRGRYYAALKRQTRGNNCTVCGKNPPVAGSTRCQHCREIQTRNTSKHHERRTRSMTDYAVQLRDLLAEVYSYHQPLELKKRIRQALKDSAWISS